MPDASPLETTARVAEALAEETLRDPAVLAAQSYVGTSSPYTFNGLVRHYFLRQSPSLADVQVQLRPKDDRSEQSHAIATRLRQRLLPVADSLGASIQVVEVPPGPPVLQTLVAEVYGPDDVTREALAGQVRDTFAAATGVVDVDWYVESDRPKVELAVDPDRAALSGLSAAHVASVVRMAGAGADAGLLHDPRAREAVPVVLRLPKAQRSSVEALSSIRLQGVTAVSVGELVHATTSVEAPSI
jgi:multidrug efflux pump subunit AcrB